MKKVFLIASFISLILVGCGQPENTETSYITENNYSYEESTTQTNSDSQPHIEEEDDGDNFGVTVDEVVNTFNKTLIDNNPDASTGDIAVCSLKDCSSQDSQMTDGRDVTIYTYYFEGSSNYRGANIIEDRNSRKVIYADLFSHNSLLQDEKLMRILQEQYYCMTAAVDSSIDIQKFNKIWDAMSKNMDQNSGSTIYNGKKFFCMGQGEGTYLGIMLP